MFGNAQIGSSPLRNSIINQFSIIMKELLNRGRIDNNIFNIINQTFQSNLPNFENLIASKYPNGIQLSELDTIIKNYINEIYNGIQQNNPIQQSTIGNPIYQSPMVSSGIYNNPITNSNPISNYDVGINNPSQPSNDIFETQSTVSNINIPHFQNQKNENIIQDQAFKSSNIKSKLSQININKYTKSINKIDDNCYQIIDIINGSKYSIPILSRRIDNKNKLDIQSTITINDENGKSNIIDNNNKTINLNNDIIKDIKLYNTNTQKLVKIIRSYNHILYPWNNSIYQLYLSYKSMLKDTDISFINKAKDIQLKDKIKINLIEYHEVIPASESLKLALEDFRIIEDNIIKPLYVKSNTEFFIDYLNALLENNIRLYNKQLFFDYGILESIDDIQEMIIDYNNPSIDFDKNDIFVYYINKIKNMFYKNVSKSMTDVSFFIDNRKYFIIDNDPITYYNIDFDNYKKFIIEVPNNYRDFILKELFLEDRNIFEIHLCCNDIIYKVTPIFIDKDFSDIVLYYQKI